MENLNDNNLGAVKASEQITTQENSPSGLSASVVEEASLAIEPSTIEPANVENHQVMLAPSAIDEPATPSLVKPSAVEPSCGCGGKDNEHQLVFAIGTIGVDFGTDAVLDSFKFFMRGIKGEDGKDVQFPDPYNPHHLLSYFEGTDGHNHMYDTLRVIWTVSQNGTPIYAIKPNGSFSELAYSRLIEFLRPIEDKDDEIHRVDLCSFPGHVTGSVKLRSGQVVPVITPNIRAMYNWRTVDLVALVNSKIKEMKDTKERENLTKKGLNYRNMIERVANKLTFQLQNFGTSSTDRALNHTATNLYNVGHVIANKLKVGYELDSIRVEKSDICRPDSDCQDVLFTFFNPRERLDTAKHVYRFTVDVSKVIPVSIGTVRDWFEY